MQYGIKKLFFYLRIVQQQKHLIEIDLSGGEGQRIVNLLFMTKSTKQFSTWESKICNMEIRKWKYEKNTQWILLLLFYVYLLLLLFEL